MDATPLFVRNSNFERDDSGDLHLRLESPCRNKGDNTAENLPETDMDGENRIIDGTGDMGAAELIPGTPCPSDADGDKDVDGKDSAAYAQNPNLDLLEALALAFGKTDYP
nr:choice-of-anchor Q domain-containing protein [uncultured Desulfobacter sp.]